MHSDWRCAVHGTVAPLHTALHVNADTVALAAKHAAVPLWSPWPLLANWMVTGVAWAGDDRSGGRATALACSGPAPLGGVADVVLVAEEPGVGLGARLAGISGIDPGDLLVEKTTHTADAKVLAAGHPTPLWSVDAPPERCAYVGEGLGLWLWAVAWPAAAGYVLAEHVEIIDLREGQPMGLMYGAPSPYLHGEE
jgi:hypothetical protein